MVAGDHALSVTLLKRAIKLLDDLRVGMHGVSFFIAACSAHCLPGETVSRRGRADLRLSGQRHILQPDAPLSDELPIVAARDGDTPELLHAPLDDWLGDDIDAALTHRA